MICKHCSKDTPDSGLYCCFCGKAVHRIPRKQTRRPNGEGCVYHRDGMPTWTAKVTDMSRTFVGSDGRVHRKTIAKSGFKTEREARAWCIDYYRGKAEKPPAPTLQHYYHLYESGEMERLSKSKQTAYRIAWRRLDSIAGAQMDVLTVADLRRVVDKNATSYYTARDMKVLLDHLFKLAAADGYCQKDLPSFIILPKLVEKEAEAFRQDEQELMWRAWDSGDQDAAIPLLMIYTGMMPGEAIGLQVEQIDLDNRTISGAGLKTATRKKSLIYLPESIIPVLVDIIGERTSGHLFRMNKDNFYKRYHDLMRRIGVRDLDPYACRHTTGTALAVTENIAPETIRKLMRWSKGSRMISRYAHPSDADAREAIGKLKR